MADRPGDRLGLVDRRRPDPSTRPARQVATDASSVTTSAPRPSPSTTQRAASSDVRPDLEPVVEQHPADRLDLARPRLDREAPLAPRPSLDRAASRPETTPDRDPSPLEEVAGQRRDDRPGATRTSPDRRPGPRRAGARTAARRRPRAARARVATARSPRPAEFAQDGHHGRVDLGPARRHRSGSPITLQRPGVFRPSCSWRIWPSLVTGPRPPAPPRAGRRPGPARRRPAVGPFELDDEQPLPLERGMLDRRRRRAEDPAELHGVRTPPVTIKTNRIGRRPPSAAGG